MIPFKDYNPASRYPIMTVLIILANLAVYLYGFTLPGAYYQQFVQSYAIIPANLGREPAVVSVASMFSSMFLHGGLLHLGGNMLFLWVFGDNIEDRMGSVRFLVFYLACGLVAGLAHILFNSDSPIPTIGASGAVAGVLGAYLLSYPYARILVLIPLIIFWPVIELPALIVLGYWFILQIFSGTLVGSEMGGVAYWAHVGGFVAGLLMISYFARRPVRGYYWREEEELE